MVEKLLFPVRHALRKLKASRPAEASDAGYVELSTVLDQVKQETARREQEGWYRSLFEENHAVMLLLDPESGAIVDANWAACRFYGYARGEITRKNIREINVLSDEEVAAEMRKAREREREVFFFEHRLASGDVRHVQVYSGPIQQGGRSLLYSIVHDVTEQRRTEAALRASEEKFRSLVESSPAGVYIIGDDRRFAYVNAALCRMLGQSAEALYGLSDAADIVSDEMRSEMVEHVQKRLSGEVKQAHYVLRARHASGEAVDLEVLGVRVNYEDRIAIVGTALDVTEQQRVRDRIRASEARYHALSELLLSYGFSYSVDAAGKRTVDWVTDSMKIVFGYSPEEMRSINWFSLVHRDDLPAYRRYSEQLLRGEPAEAEFRALRRDGTVRWMRAKSFPEWDDGLKRVVRVYGAGQDITAQKELELELVRQKERAEEMTRLKDAFLANMNHEIRTPLASVLGAADLLWNEADEDSRELVDFIRLGGERLLDTLNSVLDLAQLEGGVEKLREEVVDVVAVAEKVLDRFRPRADELEIDLRLETIGGESIRHTTDRRAVERVMTNLVSNAVKFTPTGSVTLRVRRGENRLYVEVEDTGVGISETFLPHIFDEFRQESEGLDRGYEGNGLGLTITRKLVDLMGGRIEVSTDKGAGTTFIVALPTIEETKRAVDLDRERRRQTSSRAAQVRE